MEPSRFESEAPKTIGSIARGEVHVWIARPDAVSGGDVLSDLLGLLSSDESRRHRRFLRATDRHHFLVAHALTRMTLSRYADVPPANWSFRPVGNGRPEIASPALTSNLRFNLSHTKGLVACAVTLNDDLGLDVENTDRRLNLKIADHYFSPFEAEQLRTLDASQQRERFFRLWTLKESYIKARGLGLALPLDGFSFRFDGDSPSVQFADSIDDDPLAWSFHERAVEPHFRLALAVRRSRQQDELIDLRKQTDWNVIHPRSG